MDKKEELQKINEHDKLFADTLSKQDKLEKIIEQHPDYKNVLNTKKDTSWQSRWEKNVNETVEGYCNTIDIANDSMPPIQFMFQNAFTKAVVKGIEKSVIKAGGSLLKLPTTVNNLKGAYYESDYKFTHGIGENLPPNTALGKYNFLCELEKK